MHTEHVDNTVYHTTSWGLDLVWHSLNQIRHIYDNKHLIVYTVSSFRIGSIPPHYWQWGTCTIQQYCRCAIFYKCNVKKTQRQNVTFKTLCLFFKWQFDCFQCLLEPDNSLAIDWYFRWHLTTFSPYSSTLINCIQYLQKKTTQHPTNLEMLLQMIPATFNSKT